MMLLWVSLGILCMLLSLRNAYQNATRAQAQRRAEIHSIRDSIAADAGRGIYESMRARLRR